MPQRRRQAAGCGPAAADRPGPPATTTSRRVLIAGLLCVGCIGAVGLLLAGRGARYQSPIEDDEEVVFFPTFGYPAPDGPGWVLHVHGWVFEREVDSPLRHAGLDGLCRFLGLEKDAAQSAIFQERAWPFLVDNERGKEIAIRLGGQCHIIGTSQADGHFRGKVHISPEETAQAQAAEVAESEWLRFQAVTRKDDARAFVGGIQLIGTEGISVISDIDDTIKITGVADRPALVQNTFLRNFEAVPGMARLYRTWAQAGARFHYVSGSPWQLYEPLSAFMLAEGFPEGSFHLKQFRFKDSTVLDLFASQESYKLEHIEPILSAFPSRRFVLVGDSGEKDPEVYGTIARKYPEQVARILIRDVSEAGSDTTRFDQAFAGVPEQVWTVFRVAEEVDVTLP